MYWALCVPHTCTNDDVKELFVTQLQKLEIPGMKKDVSLEEFMCQKKNRPSSIAFGTAATGYNFFNL